MPSGTIKTMRRFEFVTVEKSETPIDVPVIAIAPEIPTEISTEIAPEIAIESGVLKIDKIGEIPKIGATSTIPQIKPFTLPTVVPIMPTSPTTVTALTAPLASETSTTPLPETFVTPPENISVMANPALPAVSVMPTGAKSVGSLLLPRDIFSLPADLLSQRMRGAITLSVFLNATFVFAAFTWMAGKFVEPEKEKANAFVEVNLEDKWAEETVRARGPQVHIAHAGAGKTRLASRQKVALTKTRPLLLTPVLAPVRPLITPKIISAGVPKPALSVQNNHKPTEVASPKSETQSFPNTNSNNSNKNTKIIASPPGQQPVPLSEKASNDTKGGGDSTESPKTGIGGGEDGKGQVTGSPTNDTTKDKKRPEDQRTTLLTRPAELLREVSKAEGSKEIPALPRLDLPPLPDVFKTPDFADTIELDFEFLIDKEAVVTPKIINPTANMALNAWLLDIVSHWRGKVALKDSISQEETIKKRLKIVFSEKDTQMTEVVLLPQTPVATPKATPPPP